mmetsp:Transcript_70006/g.198412  ORF Transcript_70006/g.198412 Transcript_70006/m.198412 type:complete len:320 (-) Transcript_70006:120-1079(-)
MSRQSSQRSSATPNAGPSWPDSKTWYDSAGGSRRGTTLSSALPSEYVVEGTELSLQRPVVCTGAGSPSCRDRVITTSPCISMLGPTNSTFSMDIESAICKMASTRVVLWCQSPAVEKYSLTPPRLSLSASESQTKSPALMMWKSTGVAPSSSPATRSMRSVMVSEVWKRYLLPAVRDSCGLAPHFEISAANCRTSSSETWRSRLIFIASWKIVDSWIWSKWPGSCALPTTCSRKQLISGWNASERPCCEVLNFDEASHCVFISFCANAVLFLVSCHAFALAAASFSSVSHSKAMNLVFPEADPCVLLSSAPRAASLRFR